jgi:hypothetical protein
MKRVFKGKAFYDSSPSKSYPLRSERDPDDIAFRLSRVEDELPPRLEDSEVRVWCENQKGRSVDVFVETSESVHELNAAFAKCLGDLDLFGDAFVQRQ